MAGSASCMSYLRGPALPVMRREDEKFRAPRAYGSQLSIGAPNTTGAAGTVGLLAVSNATYPGSCWGCSAGAEIVGEVGLMVAGASIPRRHNGNGALERLLGGCPELDLWSTRYF